MSLANQYWIAAMIIINFAKLHVQCESNAEFNISDNLELELKRIYMCVAVCIHL